MGLYKLIIVDDEEEIRLGVIKKNKLGRKWVYSCRRCRKLEKKP